MPNLQNLIDPNWLKEDEHVGSVVTRNPANLAYILNYVDEKIISVLAKKQVNLFDVPLKQSAGTGTISSDGTAIVGSGTSFSTELSVGVIITAGTQSSLITAITDNTNLTVSKSFSPDISGETFTISGYVDSIPLKRYGVAVGLLKMCTSFHGSGRGEKDIYFDKKTDYEKEMVDALSILTKESITGIYDPETGIPDSVEAFTGTIQGFL